MVEIVGPKDDYIDDGEAVPLPTGISMDYFTRKDAFEKRMSEDWSIHTEEGNMHENDRLAKLAERQLDAAVLAKTQETRDAIWAKYNARKLQAKMRNSGKSSVKAVAEEKMRMSLPEVVYADWNVESADDRHDDHLEFDDDPLLDIDVPRGGLSQKMPQKMHMDRRRVKNGIPSRSRFEDGNRARSSLVDEGLKTIDLAISAISRMARSKGTRVKPK